MIYEIKTPEIKVGRYFTSFNTYVNEVEKATTDRTNWTIGAEIYVKWATTAIDFMRRTDTTRVSTLAKKIKAIQKDTARRYIRKVAVVGIEPCVPNFIAGVPNNMYDVQITRRKQKQVDMMLVYNFSHTYSDEALASIYKILVPVIQILKNKNYHANVNLIMPFEHGNAPLVINILKDSKMDINALSAITDPEHFMRGLSFFYIRCLGVEMSDTLGRAVSSDYCVNGAYSTPQITNVCKALGTNFITINCASLVDVIASKKGDLREETKLIMQFINAVSECTNKEFKRDKDCYLKLI